MLLNNRETKAVALLIGYTFLSDAISTYFPLSPLLKGIIGLMLIIYYVK